MNHFTSIQILSARILELRKEIDLELKIINKPVMPSDSYYAKINIENFKKEIESITTTLQFLVHS